MSLNVQKMYDQVGTVDGLYKAVSDEAVRLNRYQTDDIDELLVIHKSMEQLISDCIAFLKSLQNGSSEHENIPTYVEALEKMHASAKTITESCNKSKEFEQFKILYHQAVSTLKQFTHTKMVAGDTISDLESVDNRLSIVNGIYVAMDELEDKYDGMSSMLKSYRTQWDSINKKLIALHDIAMTELLTVSTPTVQ